MKARKIFLKGDQQWQSSYFRFLLFNLQLPSIRVVHFRGLEGHVRDPTNVSLMPTFALTTSLAVHFFHFLH